MSYNSFLDTYFSSYWFGFGIPVALMILYIGLHKYIRKGKPYTFAERTIVIAVAAGIVMISGLVNPLYWGYGKPQAIDDIRFEKGKLLVMDHIMTMGSRYESGSPCSRVHVLDPLKGEKQLRFLVGEQADLIGMHGDSITVSRYNDFGSYSATSGKCYAVYSRETLPKLFTELASGVNSIMWGDGRNIMEITAQDGRNWNLYGKTGKLEEVKSGTDRPKHIPTNRLFIHEKEIRIDDEHFGSEYLELKGEGENQHRLQLCNANDSVLNTDLVFLDGRPVAINMQDSSFVILHFETLKKERFILTCLTLDGKKKLWEIRQSQFNSTYNYPDYYEPRVDADEHSGLLCFSIDKEVFAVQLKTGKEVWRVKL